MWRKECGSTHSEWRLESNGNITTRNRTYLVRNLLAEKIIVSSVQASAMILWRDQKIEELSKRDLEFALQDAVLEIERQDRTTSADASFTGYIWGFTSASFLALAGLFFAALIT